MHPVKRDIRKTGGTFRRRLLVLGFGCLLVIMVVTSFFGKKGVMDINRARHRMESLRTELEALKAERAKLDREIRELERDPMAVEKEAREKLWLIKPGEKVIVIPDRKK
jgi:cell division protein FtsB